MDTTNFQPDPQDFDDVEGHVRSPMVDRLDTQAAAARGTSGLGKAETRDDGDDTEGHGIRKP